MLASKDHAIELNKPKTEDETPASMAHDTHSRIHSKPVSKPELQEGRSRASTNLNVIKNINMDVLRNKLMNTEIQKEGALKLAETFRDKYIKMQDLISNMMDQKQIGNQLPPDPAKKEKFIKPHKRHALGNQVVKHSHNNSIQLENQDSISPNTATARRKPKDSSEVFNSSQMSRDNSRRRRTTNLASLVQGFQKGLNFPIELQPMEDNVNLYSKELQKR